MKIKNNELPTLEIQEEYLDIVDRNDCVIETLPRSVVYEKNLCSQMRSVWLMIKNKKGQLWIPRRNWNLSVLPGHLDGSVVGHVQAGESYEQALHRETCEEIGIDMKTIEYHQIALLNPHDHGAFCFMALYECQMEQAPQAWNKNDIDSWQWIYPADLLALIDQGEKAKEMLPKILKQFYI